MVYRTCEEPLILPLGNECGHLGVSSCQVERCPWAEVLLRFLAESCRLYGQSRRLGFPFWTRNNDSRWPPKVRELLLSPTLTVWPRPLTLSVSFLWPIAQLECPFPWGWLGPYDEQTAACSTLGNDLLCSAGTGRWRPTDSSCSSAWDVPRVAGTARLQPQSLCCCTPYMHWSTGKTNPIRWLDLKQVS